MYRGCPANFMRVPSIVLTYPECTTSNLEIENILFVLIEFLPMYPAFSTRILTTTLHHHVTCYTNILD